MEDITTLAVNSINKYFYVLSLFGYKKYDEVYSLLSILFIEEILNGKLSDFIKENDYKLLLDCICKISHNSCLVGYTHNISNDTLIHKDIIKYIPRTSEGQIVRVSEGSTLRKI